jgi:hypothetical protein
MIWTQVELRVPVLLLLNYFVVMLTALSSYFATSMQANNH